MNSNPNPILALEEVVSDEREHREKERAALCTALKGIEGLQEQITGIQGVLTVKDSEREVGLDRIAVLDREAEAFR
jgi:hypothetical protein